MCLGRVAKEGTHFLSRAHRIVAVFSLAALLSAWSFVSYSGWVEALYTANRQKFAPAMFGNGGNVIDANKDFYRANVALTKYADRKWPIFCLGFPLAMTLAILITSKAGWLEHHIDNPQTVIGLIPVYCAPGLVLFLSAVSWFILAIPSLVLAAYLLTLSLNLMTSRRPTKFFRTFLVSSAACGTCGLFALLLPHKSSEDIAWRVFFVSLQVAWGGVFGMGLAAPLNVGR
jgi:hypothetical protein